MSISSHFLESNDSSASAYLTVHHPESAPIAAFLVIPPFAEEMMKSRQQFTQFAQVMCKRNIVCGIVDVTGTGDAYGELADTTWSDWCEDVAAAFAAMQRISPNVSVLGLRLGALLALDACASRGLPVDAAVLWEPQFSGKTALKQFMRIAAIGAKMQGREAVDTNLTGTEVGGYWIANALEASINAASAPSLLPAKRAYVVRLTTEDAPSIPPGWEGTLSKWREAGAVVDTLALQCPAFWTTTEITTNLPLIEQSVAWWHRTSTT